MSGTTSEMESPLHPRQGPPSTVYSPQRMDCNMADEDPLDILLEAGRIAGLHDVGVLYDATQGQPSPSQSEGHGPQSCDTLLLNSQEPSLESLVWSGSDSELAELLEVADSNPWEGSDTDLLTCLDQVERYFFPYILHIYVIHVYANNTN